ncbi:hypothetical protein NDU88_002613 [Pleurodeles waltl]|uniref:Uncharacterized protein n=1 Tax=Pleurodeles waltl TaxID=8319 RepID=A0AAV7L406_PLEWA|nr:hypothetical protein NDU88_002613 [Pleurodeles waltl]
MSAPNILRKTRSKRLQEVTCGRPKYSASRAARREPLGGSLRSGIVVEKNMVLYKLINSPIPNDDNVIVVGPTRNRLYQRHQSPGRTRPTRQFRVPMLPWERSRHR